MAASGLGHHARAFPYQKRKLPHPLNVFLSFKWASKNNFVLPREKRSDFVLFLSFNPICTAFCSRVPNGARCSISRMLCGREQTRKKKSRTKSKHINLFSEAPCNPSFASQMNMITYETKNSDKKKCRLIKSNSSRVFIVANCHNNCQYGNSDPKKTSGVDIHVRITRIYEALSIFGLSCSIFCVPTFVAPPYESCVYGAKETSVHHLVWGPERDRRKRMPH